MKILVLTILTITATIVAAATNNQQDQAFSPIRIIRAVNAASKAKVSTWYAAPNSLFMNKTWNQIQGMFISEAEFKAVTMKQSLKAAMAQNVEQIVEYSAEAKAQVPESYSVDLEYPKCRIGIMTQGNCTYRPKYAITTIFIMS